MKLKVLILISTIAVSSSAILFPNDMDKYKVSYDKTNRLGRIKDDYIKVNHLDNEEDNLQLEPRNIIKTDEFGVHNLLRTSNGNKIETIKPFDRKIINNQEILQPKKLHTFNFYAKRINRNRKNNNDMNESLESKMRNSAIASPRKLIKKTPEDKQILKEFNYMKNKNFVVNERKNKRQKRSSNIIEEENLFTTVSALKYTGRDTRLTNDLYFKNINQ